MVSVLPAGTYTSPVNVNSPDQTSSRSNMPNDIATRVGGASGTASGAASGATDNHSKKRDSRNERAASRNEAARENPTSEAKGGAAKADSSALMPPRRNITHRPFFSTDTTRPTMSPSGDGSSKKKFASPLVSA